MTDAVVQPGGRAKRRWLYLPFAIAAALVFAYYLLWRAGVAEIKSGVDDWVAEQRAVGLEVSHGAVRAEGFPFFLRVHVEAPAIASPAGWEWRTERLSLDALPYDFNRLVFSIRSEQQLALADGGAWRINAGDFRASIARDAARGWVFSVSIADARGRRDDGAAEAEAASFIFDLAPDAGDKTTLVLSLAAAGLSLKDGDRAVALDGLRSVLAATQTQALGDADLWRAAGGALVVNGLEAEAGASKLSVSGEVSIDADGYPQGVLKSEVAGPAPFVAILEDAGVISPAEARIASAGLTLAAIASGGKITAPIVLKGGEARIANVHIAGLPPIAAPRR